VAIRSEPSNEQIKDLYDLSKKIAQDFRCHMGAQDTQLGPDPSYHFKYPGYRDVGGGVSIGPDRTAVFSVRIILKRGPHGVERQSHLSLHIRRVDNDVLLWRHGDDDKRAVRMSDKAAMARFYDEEADRIRREDEDDNT
jgi:hypothetical protein